MFGSLLPRSFYERDPRKVARELLGKILLRDDGNSILAGRIVETEAYLGKGDLAAHTASGLTPRNAVLFGPAGHAYVYLVYGMHFCMNISCERKGIAGCVLIRALEPLDGIEEMAVLRRVTVAGLSDAAKLNLLSSGPGRLCQALHITRDKDSTKDLTSKKSDLRVVDDGLAPNRILTSPRVGIKRSRDLQLRYFIAGNRFVTDRKL